MRHNHWGLPLLRIMDEWILHCEGPAAVLSESYFDARFRVLREPLGFSPNAARLPDDDKAIHAWIESNEKMVVSVGRIHLIPRDSCGSSADTVDDNSAQCPDFTPLVNEGMKDVFGNQLPPLSSIRPAVQIRQMGTLTTHQRQGHAGTILIALEEAAVKAWGNCTGFLQARVAAIPFYQSLGWVCFDGEYVVDGIGTHCSMWKELKKT